MFGASDLGPLGRNIHVQPPSEAQLQQEFASLATQGKWHGVLELIAKYTAWQQQQEPLVHASSLTCTTYKVLALMKLGRHSQAADELSQLGDLDHTDYQSKGPHGQVVSAVPFALRYLACMLPARLGKQHVTLDLLYRLKAHCQEQQRNGSNSNSTSSSNKHSETGGKAAADWARRHQVVCCAVMACHLQQHDVHAALVLMEQLLEEYPHDPSLWSTLGQLQLRLGDVAAAGATFAWVEALLQGPEGALGALPAAQQHRLLRHNEANMKLMAQDYAGAAAAFEAAIADDPSDAVAANNRALCLLHLGQLQEAVTQLEAGLAEQPAAFLQEPVLANLGALYDVALPANSRDARHQMITWAMRLVPDDFDLTCLQPK